MKNAFIVLVSFITISCTSHHSMIDAHTQAGTPNIVKPAITGKVDQVYKNGILGKRIASTVSIYFDNTLQISGKLDRHGFGELPGLSYQDKPVSSTCSSRATGPKTAELSCVVYINSVRASTLIMQIQKVPSHEWKFR